MWEFIMLVIVLFIACKLDNIEHELTDLNAKIPGEDD